MLGLKDSRCRKEVFIEFFTLVSRILIPSVKLTTEKERQPSEIQISITIGPLAQQIEILNHSFSSDVEMVPSLFGILDERN